MALCVDMALLEIAVGFGGGVVIVLAVIGGVAVLDFLSGGEHRP